MSKRIIYSQPGEEKVMSTAIVTAAFIGVLVAKWSFYSKYYSNK